MNPRRTQVCVLGHHKIDNGRSVSVKAGLAAAGFQVLECRSELPYPLRHFALARMFLQNASSVRWVWATEGGHRLVPVARRYVHAARRKLVFDPLISRFNTRVEDRGVTGRRSLGAAIAWWGDWRSTHAADWLVFDTAQHRDYFYSRYRPTAPNSIIPLGVDECVFRPPKPERFLSNRPCEVLFYGYYIPLQGVETILEAASLLRGRGASVRFTIIGAGQTETAVRRRAENLGLDNCTFLAPVPLREIADRLAIADVSLGIFGASRKAQMVIPNKVVQAAAVGKPIITGDTDAMRVYFSTGMDALLVQPGDPTALAGAVERLSLDPDLRLRLGQAARRTFEQNFSTASLAEKLLALDEVVTGRAGLWPSTGEVQQESS